MSKPSKKGFKSKLVPKEAPIYPSLISQGYLYPSFCLLPPEMYDLYQIFSIISILLYYYIFNNKYFDILLYLLFNIIQIYII